MSNLVIAVGSKNPVKVEAITNVFSEATVVVFEANSLVKNQPNSDEETINGAINRAKQARLIGDIGIGLEAGVCKTNYGLFLINYGALVDKSGHIYLAGGTRILLPLEIELELEKGLELGTVMDNYTNRIGIKHEEGAVGIFTNNRVIRINIFEHIALLLKGQYETQNYLEKG